MRRGFSLVELLVVIGIVSMLMALLLPSLEQALFSANVTACAQVQKNAMLAAQQYAQDFKQWLPPTSWRVSNAPSFMSAYHYTDHRFYAMGLVWSLDYLADANGLIDPGFVNNLNPQTIAKNAGYQLVQNGKPIWSKINRVTPLVAAGWSQGCYGLRAIRLLAPKPTVAMLCAIGGTVDAPQYEPFGAHANRVANASYSDGHCRSLDERTYLYNYAKYATHPLTTNSWSVNLADLQCWWGYKSPWTWANEEDAK